MEYRFSDRVSSLKPSAIREIFKYAADPSVVSLSAGNPSPDAFPSKEIAEISAKVFAEDQCFGGLHSAEKAPYGIYEKGA